MDRLAILKDFQFLTTQNTAFYTIVEAGFVRPLGNFERRFRFLKTP